VTLGSDLYSIGVVTVEMLAGRFSYEEILFDEVTDRIAAGKRALADRHYSLPPSVPPNVKRFVGSLIQPDPGKRPETARAALRKLNSLDYVDWRRTEGSGLLGEWIGTWPPRRAPEGRRQYRVHSSPVQRGKQAGRPEILIRTVLLVDRDRLDDDEATVEVLRRFKNGEQAGDGPVDVRGQAGADDRVLGACAHADRAYLIAAEGRAIAKRCNGVGTYRADRLLLRLVPAQPLSHALIIHHGYVRFPLPLWSRARSLGSAA
jgi:hypothetical protein